MKSTIGIIGGGQLGRMLAFDAKKLGFTVKIIDPTPFSPAGQVTDHQIVAAYNDEKAIRELGKTADFLTFEIELANAAILDELSQKGVAIHPNAKTLGIIKDKFAQKQFLKKAGIPVADFVPVLASEADPVNAKNIQEEIKQIAKQFGYPLLLKARFDAYDGRGNALIQKESAIISGVKKLFGRKLYVEKFIPFTKELAVVVARNTKGQIASYPVVETIHKNNICHVVLAPAPITPEIAKKANALARKTMRYLAGAGVFGIEMFLTKEGSIWINEISPRVHNSGHFTMEGCITSQFEQHIRAITNLPLGSTAMQFPAAVMINILGERTGQAAITGLGKVLEMRNVFVHIYGKAETKEERKMGHITVVGNSVEECLRKAKKARAALTI